MEGSLFLVTIMLLLWASNGSPTGSMYCYECNSYMGACKDYVDNSLDTVYKTKCYSKCFIHYGEEGNDVLYRGCFDYYQEVNSLSYNYVGCRNQSWNGQEIMWCLCDSDLCNGESMNTMAKVNIVYDKAVYDEKSKVGGKEVRDYFATETYDTHNTPSESYQTSHETSSQNYIDLDSDSLKYFGEYPYYGEESYKEENSYQEVDDAPNDDDYKTVDQVHYGSSDDIYVQGGDYASKQTSTYPSGAVYERSDDVYTEEDDMQTYTDEVVPEPYYPYEENEVETYTPAEVTEAETEEIPKQRVSAPKLPDGKVYCTRTGYFQNPEDCNAFIACIMDPHVGKPVLYPMRCPDGLDWDNDLHICRHQSPTCGIPQNPYGEGPDPYASTTSHYNYA